MKYSVIVVGAGIMGSAVAYELSMQGFKNIAVIDADLDGGLSSTERNAGGVRHLWQQPENRKLSALSIEFFESIANEIGFKQDGYLWLYSPKTATLGDSVFDAVTKDGLPYAKLLPSEIESKYPFLNKLEDVSFGLFGNRDGILNSNALKNYFREHAQENGVIFLNRLWMKNFYRAGSETRLELEKLTSQHCAEKKLWAETSEAERLEKVTLACDKLILCAGAWTPLVLPEVFSKPAILPVRRQISFFDAENFNETNFGMIVDTSGVYFHPEGGKILAGYVVKDEKPGYRFDYDSHFFEEHIWPKLYERSTYFERLKHISGWAGLYSYTPDISGILGELPRFKNIYECHSFTGHGIMQSFGAAKLLVEKIKTGSYQTFNMEKMSRNRFENLESSKWLFEKLHI